MCKNLKFVWKYSRMSRQLELEQKGKSGDVIIPDFSIHKEHYRNQTTVNMPTNEKRDLKINLCICNKLFLIDFPKTYVRELITYSVDNVRIIDIHMEMIKI